MVTRSGETDWQDTGTFSVRLLESDVTRHFFVELYIKSSREYHASSGYDDSLALSYQVLPPKRVS
jgi:hypothetical protein